MIPEPPPPRFSSGQLGCAGIIAAVSGAVVYYHAVHGAGLQQTAALFIGLPTLLAILLVLTPRAKTATGAVVKGTTVALLASAPLLQEGFICILMASPLIYFVAVVIGLVVDYSRRRNGEALGLAPILPLLLMSLEGTSPELSLPRAAEVQVHRVVRASVPELRARAAAPMRADVPLDGLLEIGFPRPGRATGRGLAKGDLRVVAIRAGERTGEVAWAVAGSSEARVRFVCVRDTSPVAGWLAWEDAELTWRPMGEEQVEATLRVRYRRLLDPAWYFGPLERMGATEAASWVLEALTREP